MAGVIHNRYPCCNRTAALRAQVGTVGRRCRGCGRSYRVQVSRSAPMTEKCGTEVLTAEWTDRQYRVRRTE